jgi:hypothetical protein
MPGQFMKVAYIPSLAKLYALRPSPDVKRLNPANLQVEWSQNHGFYARNMDWVEPALTITSVAPYTACSGTTVTITGSGFQGEVQDGAAIVQQRTRVFFGNVEATSVTLIDSMHLSVVVPPQPPGNVNVEVRNPNGLSAILTNGFGYPPLARVEYPNGGEQLVINDVVTLRWDACAEKVDILLSRNGVNGSYSMLYPDADNTGTKNWPVTGPKTTGPTAFLKVVAKTPGVPSFADTSDSGFTINRLITTVCPGCPASYCSGEGVRCNLTGPCGPGGCCNYSCVTDMTCIAPDPCPENLCGGC